MITDTQQSQTKVNPTPARPKSRTSTRRLRTPLRWFGGRGRIVSKLLPMVPPHSIYVEVFGGGASLLLAKKHRQSRYTMILILAW